MKRYFLGSILALFTILNSSFTVAWQDPVSSAPKVPFYRTGAEGTITGTIIFQGQAPKPKQIDESADQVCETLTPEALTEDVVVNDGKLANVLIYIKSGNPLDTFSFESPASVATLAHRNCRYEPHVLAIRVGQYLTIANDDATHHNTHPTPSANEEWNQTQAPDALPLLKIFKRAEIFIPFRDNQHPWEKAYLSVFTHPFFAITDQSGRYQIEGLPPGQYTLAARHERLGEKTLEIRIAPGEAKATDFTFDARNSK